MVTSLQTQQLLNTTKQQKYDFFKNGSSSQGNPYAKYDFFANTQQNTSAAPTQKYDFFSRLEQKKAGTLSQTLPQTSSSQNEGWGKDYLDLLQNTYMKLTSDLASGGARMLGKSAEVFGYEQAAQNLKDTANGVQLKYQDWLKQNPDKIARDTSDDNWLQKGLYGLSGALTYTLPIMALNFVPGVGTALSASAMYLTAEENLREDLVESGASEEQADKLAMIGGGIIGALDYVSGGTIMKPIKKMFQKNLSSALVKSGLANTIKTVGKSMVMEGSTEALQQVVQNAFVKTVDENRSMMKDVGENALYGGIMGGMFGGLHAGYNNALANQKEATIEQQARDYVEGTTVEKTGNSGKNQYNLDQELLVEGKTKYATPAYQLDKNTYSSNFFAKQDKQGLYVETKKGKTYSYTGPEPFTNATTFSLDKNTRKYRTNFDNFIKNKDNATTVGITKLGKKVTLTDSVFEHIIKDHGIFDPNSLIATIAKPDNTRRELQGQKRPYFLKKTLSSNHYLLLGLKPSNDGKSYKITSFYERYDNKSQRLYTSQTDDITSREAVFQQKSGHKYGVGDPAQKEIAGELGKEQIRALAKKYGIDVEIVETILTPEGKKAYGQYHNQLITLAKNIKEGTAPHELLHAVFKLIDTDTRTFMLSELMKEEGISAAQAEEKLADMFSNFFLARKVGKAPKSVRGTIKQFFKKVVRFINGYAKSYQAIEQLFDDIVGSENVGELHQRISENSDLEAGRARMKKRFLNRMKEIKEIWEYERDKESEIIEERRKKEEKSLTYQDLGWTSKEYNEYLTEKLGLTEEDFLEAENSGRKTGNSQKNQYTSDNADSVQSSNALIGEGKEAIGTKSGSSGSRGGNPTQMSTAFSRIFKRDSQGKAYITDSIGNKIYHYAETTEKKKREFRTKQTFPLSEESQGYKEGLLAVMEDKISEAPIAIMDGIVSKDFDSKPRNLIFSWEKFRKIFQKHGEFFPENLLETVNNPSVVIKNVKYRGEHIKEKINILKTIPGYKDFLIVGADKNNGFLVLTSMESSVSKTMDEWIQERIETPDDIVIDNRNNNPKNTSLPKYQVFDDPEYGMIHSLSLDKLEKAVELGGLAGPSFAIQKVGAEIPDFGEIVLIPKIGIESRSESNITNFDSYSPRIVTDEEIILKNASLGESEYEKVIKNTPSIKKLFDESISKEDFKLQLENTEDIYSSLEKLSDKANMDFYEYVENITDAGYPTKKRTLETVVESMFENGIIDQEGMPRSHTFQRIKKVGKEDFQQEKRKLSTKSEKELQEKYNKLRDDGNDLLLELMNYGNNRERSLYGLGKSVQKSLTSLPDISLSKKEQVKEAITKSFEEEGIGVSSEIVHKIFDLVNKYDKIERTYMENKYQGGISWDDIEYAIVPISQAQTGGPSRVETLFEQNGIPTKVITYTPTGEFRTPSYDEITPRNEKVWEIVKKYGEERRKQGNIRKKYQVAEEEEEMSEGEKKFREYEQNQNKENGEFDSSIFEGNTSSYDKMLREEKETQAELNKQAGKFLQGKSGKTKDEIRKEKFKAYNEKQAIRRAKQFIDDKKKLEEAERNIKIQKIGKLTKEQQKRLNEKYKTDTEAFFAEQERKRQERYEQKKEVKIEYVKEDSSAKAIMEGTKIGKRQSFKEWIKGSPLKDLLQPISTRVKNISKEVHKELMAYEQRVIQKGNERLEEVKPFIEVLIKIRKESPTVYTNLWLDLVNGNVGKANELLKQYGTSIPRKVLDEIRQDSEDVGYTMNYEGFYYPRKVENPQEFIEMIFKSENPAVVSVIEERIRQLEEKNGPLTAEQKAQAINEMLLEGEVEGVKLGSGHMKNRKIDHVTAAMLKYYQDPVASLNSYIVGMTEAIEKARFLGRSQSGKIRTLGQVIEKQGIKGKDADTLLQLLQDRMNYQGTSTFLQSMKDIGNIIHLGSPSSALTQFGDLSFSVIENGFGNVLKAIINKSQFDLKKMGIQSLGEEFASLANNETLLQKTQRNVFKLTGFQFMDSFGKNVYLNSTWNRWMKYAKKNDPQLRKDISRRFEDTETIDQIMQDIKAGKMTPNVNLLLFMKLANIQPLTKSQMPAIYLNSPNGRISYAFKTFGIKQLDYLIQETKRNFQENPTPQALLKVVQMMMIIILLGASVDEIKDFSMGRKANSWIWRLIEGNEVGWDQIWGRFGENILKLTGLTRYSIYQAKSEGLGTVVEDLFLSIPGIDIVKYPTNDISKVFTKDGLDWSQAETRQMLPIIGKYGYWWLGKGQTKQQNTLDKENKNNSRSRSSTRSRTR